MEQTSPRAQVIICGNAAHAPLTNRVWHPNTQMREWSKFDEIVSADGMHLCCKDGSRLLDGVASMWCNVWGHSNKELAGAIQKQAGILQHSPMFNLTHGPAEELAKMLAAICPGMEHAFYTDNGSSAMEVSVKTALQYWKNKGEKRTQLVSLQGGYHGDTVGAMSIGYSDAFFSQYQDKLFQCRQMPVPDRRRLPRGRTIEEQQSACLDKIESALQDGLAAALVMESGAQVAAGAVIYPPKFQSEISKICRRHQVLLVLDEIATGLGRLGSMAEYAAQKSRPDIVSFGKMLTGGYLTMAATLSSRKVYRAFLGKFGDNKHLFHGHTYTGNPIAAAASVANLKMYEKHDLIGSIARKSKIFAENIPRLESLKAVCDVRHKGMLMGIDLANDATKAPFASKSPNYVLYHAAKKHGVYLRTLGSTVLLVPPLAISEGDLQLLIDRTVDTIKYVQGRVQA